MKKSERAELIKIGLDYLNKFDINNDDVVYVPTKTYFFMKEMVERLQNNKSLSQSQLKWFNSAAFEEPKQYNVELVKELKTYWDLTGISEYSRNALKDFTIKLSQGKVLTINQKNFLDMIVEDAKEIIKNGPWRPTQSQEKKLLTGFKLSSAYDPYYLQNRPKLSQAIQNVALWFDLKVNYITKQDYELVSNVKKNIQNEINYFENNNKAGDLKKFIHDGSNKITLINNYTQTSMNVSELRNFFCMLVSPEVEINFGIPFANVFLDGEIVKVYISNLQKGCIVNAHV